MDLATLTSGTPTTKPWLTIVSKSVSTDVLSANSFAITDLKVTTMETKGDVQVGGYISASQDNQGNVLVSTSNGFIATTAGTAGTQVTFNPVLNKASVSGVTGGTNIAFSTTDGFATFTVPVLPIAGTLLVMYSPGLGYYSVINNGANQIYTTPDFTTGSFTARPVSTTNFDCELLQWSTNLNRFLTCSADTNNRVMYSLDGINYVKVPSTRRVRQYQYSPEFGLLIAVGEQGPMWSPDSGITWTNSTSLDSMACVAYSPFWKLFVAPPRTTNLTSVYTSTDGKTWLNTPGAFPVGFNNIRAIRWIQELMIFIATGDAVAGKDIMLISQDGFKWRSINTVGTLNQGMYGNAYISEWGQYVQVANSNVVRVTPRRFIA